MIELTAMQVVQMTNCSTMTPIGDQRIERVTINSREVTHNCLFVAIAGHERDGHDYVAAVVTNSSNFALVRHDFPQRLANLIYVDDTILALGRLSAAYRRRFELAVVAITGSNGKTTVKEMLKSICNHQFGTNAVIATPGNLNNHLGVPLSLLYLAPC